MKFFVKLLLGFALSLAGAIAPAQTVTQVGTWNYAPQSNIFLSVSGASGQSMGTAFSTLVMGTVVSAVGFPASNYNTATGIFTVPQTGVYQITGTIRWTDNQAAGIGYAVGVHSSNADGYWTLWGAIPTTNNVQRRASYPYVRTDKFNAGDQLRMFTYVDGSTMPMSFAAMQIKLLF